MARESDESRDGFVGLSRMIGADPLSLVVTAYLVMSMVMVGLWALQLTLPNASIADVGFCGGLIATVLWYATQASGETERKLILSFMVCVYAGRLGLYILFDRVLGKSEDARYREVRRRWGNQERVKMFGYFHLQALAVSVLSLPFLVAMQNPRPPFGLWELWGFLLWMVAVIGEAAADWQLARFRAQPWNRERVCRTGLWCYSRHPNYFFELLHWCALVIISIGAPGWPMTWIGPISMGWALLKVTGIPLVEERAVKSRGEEYRDYQRTTNKLIPWWPSSSQ